MKTISLCTYCGAPVFSVSTSFGETEVRSCFCRERDRVIASGEIAIDSGRGGSQRGSTAAVGWRQAEP